jgi:hypothetical protein
MTCQASVGTQAASKQPRSPEAVRKMDKMAEIVAAVLTC